jgi:hypothetical protein
MGPTIRVGDVLLVDPETVPVPGSVVTYRDADRGLITHRLRAVEEDGMLHLRGDANAADDPPVPASAVAGSGRVLVPLVGLPVVWLQQGHLVPLATSAAIVLLLAAPRVRWARGDRRDMRRTVLRPGLSIGLVAVLVLPPAVSDAALTARTTNVGNSMSVVTVPPATDLQSSCTGVLAATVTLTWTPSTTGSIDSQLVQRAEGVGPWETIEVLGPIETTTDDTNFPLLGATYSYRIVTTTTTALTSTSATTQEFITVLGLC